MKKPPPKVDWKKALRNKIELSKNAPELSEEEYEKRINSIVVGVVRDMNIPCPTFL